MFPTAKQARKSIWKGRGSDGLAFIDHIPKQLIKKINNMEMIIELINGSIIQLLGASNVDTVRGSNPVTIAYSEFMYLSPYVRDTLSPILAENGGIEILNGTPNGKGPAYKVFTHARSANDEWCTTYLTVKDTFREDGITPVISLAQIDEFRRSGMSEEMIQQEFYCSWDSGSPGAYYTQWITSAEIEGRVENFTIQRNLPVMTFWDIGIGDSTAIWFLQVDGNKLKMVYYYENNGQGFDHYNQKLHEVSSMFGFKYVAHFGPHDMANRQWGATLKSTLAIARECGINFRITPKLSKQEGIEAVRRIFKDVWIHKVYCEHGLEALRHYKKEWNEDLRDYHDKPLHDWSSHAADAFRYFSVAYLENYTRPDLNSPMVFENAFQKMA